MDKKKIAAILAGVDLYIKVEQETAAPPPRPIMHTMWGMDGRRQIMNMRNLWQLRIFKQAH